ncbi:NifU-like domain-containing protein [Scenedesmus sp. NREL 46B-D3]|nr:NifU-like domain-containing protein [Scenedesmus sp. NREL 46B-D3]
MPLVAASSIVVWVRSSPAMALHRHHLLANYAPCSTRARALAPSIHQPQYRAAVRGHALPDAAAGLPGTLPSVVTNDAVPEGHKSLHNALYGQEGDAHASSRRYNFREGEDDGSSILAVPGYLDSREGEKPLGVYAVYDERHALQFVGYSRNMVLAVKSHLARVGEERCAFGTACQPPHPYALICCAHPGACPAQVEDWLAEAGVTPPGNGVEAQLWGLGGSGEASTDEGGAAVDVALMSSAERSEYEERKLKLRKAMGENLLDDEDVDADAAQRRLALMAAVSGDNWSSVVSQQTEEALQAAVAAGGGRLGGRQNGAPEPAAAAAAAGTGPEQQPAAGVGEKHEQAGKASQAGAPPPEMTAATVDAALDEVRPYLMADGGDVAVVGVEGGVVAVALQGACSSCASSSATLKMGIERQLRAVFGEQLLDVVQVDSGGKPKASVEAVDMHLNMLRSAVANLGGAVEVASVGSGGISSAVKDAFPDLKEVVVKDFPAEQQQ